MSYEEYKAIAGLVDIFFKNWVSASGLSLVGEQSKGIQTGLLTAFTQMYPKMIFLVDVVEKYPDYKKRWLEEIGYVTPSWAEEVMPK